MFSNKLIHFFTTLLTPIILPIQIVSTLVLGTLITLSFNLFLVPLNLIWSCLFYLLLFFSYIYEKYPLTRFLVSLFGVPLAIITEIYVCLTPSMGDFNSRAGKMVFCYTFPFCWRYVQLIKGKINIDKNDELNPILKEICKAAPLQKYLDTIFAEIISRDDYISGKYQLDVW